ncbi:MAG: hypothetical protein Q9197_006982 [Variospora fuerteventurae]
MGKATKPSLPKATTTSISSTVSVNTDSSSESDATTLCPPPPPYTPGPYIQSPTYLLWYTPHGPLKITTLDTNNTLYTVHNYGFLDTDSTTHVVTGASPSPEADPPAVATITRNDSNDAKAEDYIDIHMAGSNAPILRLHRDGGVWRRKRHRVCLSDGKTYQLKVKHTSDFLLCWENMKVVKEARKGKKHAAADFKAKWVMSSLHKIGVVRFWGEVEEQVMKEVLLAFVGVVRRDFVVAMASASC